MAVAFCFWQSRRGLRILVLLGFVLTVCLAVFMSLIRKIPACLDGICSVVMKEDGSVCHEKIGSCGPEDGSTAAYTVVLYQKDLLPALPVERSHRSLISPFKIKVGQTSAFVPWWNFSWACEKGMHGRVQDTPCDLCNREGCYQCFSALTADDILVVFVHGLSGDRVYQWYAIFDRTSNVLTRIPSHFLSKIAATCVTTGFCKCGGCRHPLYKMVNRRSDVSAQNFDNRAISYFADFHKRVLIAKNDATGVGYERAVGISTDVFATDTCSVCLEETLVSSTCAHERCRMKVCAECTLKTRGMCPLCDRSKFNNAVAFLCHSCSTTVPLHEYGHPCNSCKDTKLCSACFKRFRVCLHCELDMAWHGAS